MNSSCSDWLTQIPVTAVDATSSSFETDTGPTGYYPTGTGDEMDSPITTSMTSIVGTITRTVYPIPESSEVTWVDWTNTFSTSTLSSVINDTNATSMSAVGPGTVTVHFPNTGTGGAVMPTTYPGEYYNGIGRLQQGTPGHLRKILQRRRAEEKKRGAAETDGIVKEQERSGIMEMVS